MVQRKFDAIHEFHYSGRLSLRSSITTRIATILPIIMNDDAQGDPMSFKAHPEHASWAEQAKPNCFPDSEIRNMKITVDFLVPKLVSAITSVVQFRYALISCAFPEDLDAIDEKSGLSLKEVLELQKETTDRQVYPLWSGIDIVDGSLMHAEVPGLTSDQITEGVNFSAEVLQDQRRYGRIKGLIKKCMPIGFRTAMLRGRTVSAFTKRITFNFTPSNAKFINPYTFLGILLEMPQVSTTSTMDENTQNVFYTDTADNVQYVIYKVHVKYNERNPEFHMGKV